MKIFVSHVNAHHQRVISAEEDFNSQVDRMSCSVETSQPLSPATPVIAQWAHQQSGHGDRDAGYAWAQQYRLPLIKADLATATTEFPIKKNQPAAETNSGPSIWCYSPGDQPASQWQTDDTGQLSLCKGQYFVLIGIDICSGYRFAFPAYVTSA